MAVEGFEWIASLKDMISKPAKEGQLALGKLGMALRNVVAEIGKAEKAEHAHGEAAHKRHNVEKGFLKEFTGSLVPEIALGELVAEGVKKIGESIVEFAHFAIEVSEFKENMISAYEVLGKGGEEMFASVDRLASSIHMPAEKAHELAQDLLTRGMEGEKDIAATIAAIGAAKRGGPAGSAERLQSIIERSLSLGKLQLRSPRELASAGLDVEKLYVDLGQRLGKGRDEIKAELKSGAIDAKVGIAAIDDAINFGKVGEIAKKKLTLTDVTTDLMNNFRKLFQDVDTGPLIRGIRDFVSIFDAGSGSAEGMKDVITGGLNTIIRWAGMALDSFSIWFLNAEIGAYDLYISLFPILDVIAKIIHGIEKLWDDWNNAAPGMSIIDKSLSAASDMVDPMQGIGFDAGKAFGTGVKEGSADALEQHSPSKVMMRMGKGAADSFGAGAESADSWAPQGNMAPIAPGGGGGSTSVTIDVGGIHITANTPEEMMPLLESQILDVFERAALELGQ